MPVVRLRCPSCGMLAYRRNLTRSHALDVFLVHYGGRGRIRWERIRPTGDPIELFWVKHLEEVITRLRTSAGGRARASSVVLGAYASPTAVELRSTSTVTIASAESSLEP